MKKLLLLMPLVALLSGCIGVPKEVPKMINALANDPATLRLRVVAAGITIELDRTAPRTNSMPHEIKDGTISVGQ